MKTWINRDEVGYAVITDRLSLFFNWLKVPGNDGWIRFLEEKDNY